jgi:hypothetical protein
MKIRIGHFRAAGFRAFVATFVEENWNSTKESTKASTKMAESLGLL